MDITTLSASQIAQKVRSKEVSASDVAKSFLQKTKTYNSKLNAYLSVQDDAVLKRAADIDSEIAKGNNVGDLLGVPIAIKDNICVEGTLTTCSSKILKNFNAPYDATVIRKLKDAGALLIGKTNLDEFAMGSSTENSAFGVTKNPWDNARVPGGSSGGSACAVAARLAPVALGSDTGGSIRQPASFCGIVGLKPTYGRVSRYGLIAFASSLDQIGPFSLDAEDNALLLKVISGHDPLDSTSADQPVPDYPAEMKKPLSGLKIGLPKEYFVKELDPFIADRISDAVKLYEKMGATVREISLPHTSYAVAVYYILAPSEASANLARFDGIRYGHRSKDAGNLVELYEKSRDEGFGPEVKRRIMLGTYALSSGYYDAYYAKAQKVRNVIREEFNQAFKDVDAILTPTVPTPAFRIGEKSSDPLQMYLSDIFTISCNLAEIPGISVPCGFTQSGLPVGFQIMGRPFDEAALLRMTYHYQSQTQWHQRLPGLN